MISRQTAYCCALPASLTMLQNIYGITQSLSPKLPAGEGVDK